jgi:hypothetical protein
MNTERSISMKRGIGSILMALAILLVGFTVEAHATTVKEYATIINLSGRQRMLTQKMSKEMLLIAKGVEADHNRAELKKTAALFDTTLKGLVDGNADMGLPATKDASTLRIMGKVQGLWMDYKAVVDGVVGGGAVPISKVADLNLPLLKTSNTAVRLYEKAAKKEVNMSAGVVINLAGKQRMLTQKMSKEVLLVSLGHNANENKLNLKKTATLFDKTLKGLQVGDTDLGLPATTDKAILDQLSVVEGLWGDMKPLTEVVYDIDSTSVSDDTVTSVAKVNLPLLKNMNKAVKMYEKAQ